MWQFFFLLIWLSKDLLNISRPASSLPTSPPSAFEPFVIRENECIQSGGTKIPATTIAHLPHYHRRRFYWVNPRKPYRSFQNKTCWDLDYYRASPMGLFAQWFQVPTNFKCTNLILISQNVLGFMQSKEYTLLFKKLCSICIKYFLRSPFLKGKLSRTPKNKTTVHKVRESPESAQLILKLGIIDKWSLNGGTSNQHDDGLIWFFSQQMLKQHLAQNTSKGKRIILLQRISKRILPDIIQEMNQNQYARVLPETIIIMLVEPLWVERWNL